MNRLLSLSNYLLLVVVVLFCLVIEGGLFNFRYLTQWLDDYERIEVITPTSAVVLQHDQQQISYDCPDTYVRNLRIEVQTYEQVNENITGKVLAKTDANRYSYFQVGNFIINPRRGFSAVDNITLSTGNQILELALVFDARRNPIKLTGLTLNAPYEFKFNFLRFALVLLVVSSTLFTLKYHLYQTNFAPEKRSHRLLNYSTLLFNIVVVLGIFALNNPITGDNVKTACMFPQMCTEYLGSETHSLLQDMPRNAQEVIDSPLYVQQLDGWLKGHLYLDIVADSRISAMDNPRDATEFYRIQLGWPFDRTYYNDHWYSYYGISPILMIYGPIYMLTGQVPTPILVATILALLAVIGLHSTITAWYRTFGVQGNLLLFLLAQLSVPAIGRVYFLQASLSHYYFAIFAAMVWVCFYFVALMKSWEYSKAYQRNLLLVLAGICLVMVVLSRPHLLLLVFAFSAPLALLLVKALKAKHIFFTWANVLSFAVPVTLGAIFVMWHNYARFDSPFEFGQKLVITAMNFYDLAMVRDLTALSDMLHHIFFSSLQYQETFPFIARPEFSLDDKTNYMFGQVPTGYFAFPAMFALFLLVAKIGQPTKVQPQTSILAQSGLTLSSGEQRFTYLVIALTATLVILFGCIWNPVIIERFITDGVWAVAFVAVFLILAHIDFKAHSKASVTLYVITVAALIKSFCLGVLLAGIAPNAFNVDQSMFFYLYDTFRPFAY